MSLYGNEAVTLLEFIVNGKTEMDIVVDNFLSRTCDCQEMIFPI